MKFIVDECVGPRVAEWLQSEGYDVVSVFEHLRGASDELILQTAHEESRIIITSDKDFGDMIFKKGKAHYGIILLRLFDERSVYKIESLKRVLTYHSAELVGNFIVVTEKTMRITRFGCV